MDFVNESSPGIPSGIPDGTSGRGIDSPVTDGMADRVRSSVETSLALIQRLLRQIEALCDAGGTEVPHDLEISVTLLRVISLAVTRLASLEKTYRGLQREGESTPRSGDTLNQAVAQALEQVLSELGWKE